MKTDIIMPCWEGNNNLELINSLNSLINNEKLINKIIIVIDGCKEFPEFLPEKHILAKKILFVYQFVNRGPGASRNTGVIFSKSENIIFLDTGDKCSKNRIKTQINSLTKYDVSVGHIKEIKNKNYSSIRFSAKNINKARKIIPYRTPFNNVTIAIKRVKYIELGGYPVYRTAEDWLFMGKIIKNKLKLLCENKILVYIDKDDLFIFRRRGKSVFKDISLCIEELYELGLINKYQKFISKNIQRFLRLYLPKIFLKIIFFLLRKNVIQT